MQLSQRLFLICSVLAGVAQAQSTQLVSLDSSGVQGLGPSVTPSMSADARYVAFASNAANLVAGDTNLSSDIFVRDRQTGTTTRVSVDSAGNQVTGDSSHPSISADGRYVAFTSKSSTLVPGDTNMKLDVFVHDMVTGTTTRVSVDSAGVEGNDESSFITAPAISGDGRYVAFHSFATNLIVGDTNAADDVFVHDMQTGLTTRVSVDSAGAEANGNSDYPALSTDGRYVVFSSSATNLVAGDTNGWTDVFVRDLMTGTTTRVNLGPGGVEADNPAYPSFSISADGRYVAFASEATNLVPSDTNGWIDIFVRDRQASQTTRVSVDSIGTQSDGNSENAMISANGRFVVFQSIATNLVATDTNAKADVFEHDLQGGETSRVNVTSGGAQSTGDMTFFGLMPSISADGHFVAFGSSASDLVPVDTNGTTDIFLRDSPIQPSPFCFGDGVDPNVSALCPCFNFGSPGHGCANSQVGAGALLAASGTTTPDSIVLTASNELPTSLSIFLQGTLNVSAGVVFGDGVRCAGGSLKRLFVKHAAGGVAIAPGGGDPSITAQSATLGDPISPSTARYYQTYYRDPSLTFCSGLGFNVTNAVRIDW